MQRKYQDIWEYLEILLKMFYVPEMKKMKMQDDEIDEWLINKSARIWKRALLLLFYASGPMNSNEITNTIQAERSRVHKTLKKLEIDSKVKSRKKNNKLRWTITNLGAEQIRNLQNKGLIPIWI